MELMGIAEDVRELLEKSMKQWKLSLTSNGNELGDVKVNRGIFQGDSLSPLLFVLCMIPMSLVLRTVKAGYELGKKEFSLNHLLFMDDLKLYGKSEEQIDSLVRTVHKLSTDIGMEFGIRKCGIIILKRGKIVRLDKMKENEMKEKTIKEYKRRLRLILKSKLNGKNKITAINTWAVAIFRYGAEIIDWKESELKSIDGKTRRMLTMYGAMHRKGDVDRLYIKERKEGKD